MGLGWKLREKLFVSYLINFGNSFPTKTMKYMFSNQAWITGHAVPKYIRGKSKQKLDHTFSQTCQKQQTQAKLLHEDVNIDVEHFKYLVKSSLSSTNPFFLPFRSLHVFPSKLSRMQGRKFFKKLSYIFLKWKVLESDIISQSCLKETGGQTKDSVIKIEELYGPSYCFTKNQH